MTRLACLPLLLAACNVTAASNTGGADLPARGECARGVAVLSSDFTSSEVAVLTPAGEMRSSSLFSSASGATSGLAAPLSGDVTVAASPLAPNELVLVDRFGTDVLTFVDVRTAAVRAQLAVGTGFEANPQDYLQVSERKAYVPRLGENQRPGRQPFDSGSDLLVLDPALPQITASVALPRKAGYRPSPSGIARVGDHVLVTLWHTRADFGEMAEAEIVAISAVDDALRYRLPVEGLQNCGRVELSPSGERLAVACQAFIDPRGNAPDPSKSGIVLFDLRQEPPREVRRFTALELVGGPLQPSLAFVSERRLLFKSQTALGAELDNRLLSLDLESGGTRELARAAPTASGAGYGIALGDIQCSAKCGDPCLIADASRGSMLRWFVDGDELTAMDSFTLGGAGLPPRGITAFW